MVREDDAGFGSILSPTEGNAFEVGEDDLLGWHSDELGIEWTVLAFG